VLGSSIYAFGTPIAFGYSRHVFGRDSRSALTVMAVFVSGVEMILILFFGLSLLWEALLRATGRLPLLP
jgi:hypothetical protein